MTATLALCTDGISKEFRGGKRAVDILSLSVASGQVYGFLGPNGAGKTTTIRILLDLVRPSHGRAYLFGKDPRRDRSALRRVGALVEGAAFYPYLSGRANLELLRRMNGGKSRPIDELLDRVGLKSHADARFGSYSTGMKQRLGIAAALLHDPDLVILDEPTNGLDPVGMVEMRDLIRSLVDRDGKTVFLSSHLLGEVEQICDRVAIIDQGHLLREGTIPELLEGRSGSVRIEVDNAESALTALRGDWPVNTLTPNASPSGSSRTDTSRDSYLTPGVLRSPSPSPNSERGIRGGEVGPSGAFSSRSLNLSVHEPSGGGANSEIEVAASRADIPKILSRLIQDGIAVYAVMPQRHSLEDLFLTLVSKTDEANQP